VRVAVSPYLPADCLRRIKHCAYAKVARREVKVWMGWHDRPHWPLAWRKNNNGDPNFRHLHGATHRSTTKVPSPSGFSQGRVEPEIGESGSEASLPSTKGETK
jgi:hypothetical protein